jgi:hypothetical protein
MRLLAVLVAAMVLAAGEPAWAYGHSLPGTGDWPAIPEPGGMAGFVGTWSPQCNNGYWQDRGPMTVHGDGKISYKLKKPTLTTQYRVVETTPYYVVLLTRGISKEYGEILRFVILQPTDAQYPESFLGWNECRPDQRDMKGFSWTDDDAALARIWRQSRSCNPAFADKKSDFRPFFGEQLWSQECLFIRFGAKAWNFDKR